MVRRGLFVLLAGAVAAAGSVSSQARVARVGSPARFPARRTSECRGGSRSGAIAARTTATEGDGSVRDRADLGRTEVLGLLAGLQQALVRRYGDSDERRLAARLPSKIVIPVRVHVVTSGSDGRVPAQVVRDQIAVLNSAYGGATGGADTGVAFRLQGSDYTSNDTWFNHPQDSEHAMKAALHKGNAGTLNLYTAAVGADMLGFSTFPQWYRQNPELDGVVIDYRSMPGGPYTHFDKGYTAVHEVGHWLGLFHTFENGCTPPGDSVDDTPYEAVPTQGCPWFKDTCTAPGDDPIHNFMDYGYDDCMTEFTPGQARRIRVVWAAYRASGKAHTGHHH